MNGLLKVLARLARGRPPVGQSPADVVFRENKWSLLRYRAPSGVRPLSTAPLLIVPSLINRHYVLDLLPGRSLVEFLVAQGHDVFMIDWGTPGDEDRDLELDTFCDRYLGRALKVATRLHGAERAHLFGYCLGGTLAAIHAALYPSRVESFVALAAPVRFIDSGLLSLWTRTQSFDIGAIVDAFGNIPWPLMQASFHLLKPTMNLQKLVQLVERAEDDEFLDAFFATETWGNDNVSFPGLAYQRYVQALYRDDALIAGELAISGQRVRLSAIDAPTLAITFEHDHIVPKESARLLLDHIGSKDKQHLHLNGGHVGAVVTKKAAHGLWPAISQFIAGPARTTAGSDRAPADRPRRPSLRMQR